MTDPTNSPKLSGNPRALPSRPTDRAYYRVPKLRSKEEKEEEEEKERSCTVGMGGRRELD